MGTFRFRACRALRCLCVVGLLLGSAGCIVVSPLGLGRPELGEMRAQDSARFFELNKIAIIDIDGFLTSSGGGGLFGWLGTSVADVKQRLKKAQEDSAVVAVVLRINSPGGEVTAADILYREILNFRRRTQNRKPVLACLMDVAASGGYYVALGADHIFAHPTTVTGSVGVIMNLTNVEGLYRKIGLKAVTVKSGGMKDIGSGTRKMTPEERAVLQRINGDLFNRFLTLVQKRRPKISAEHLRVIADGRVLTSAQALEFRMIDGVGYLGEVIEAAKRAAGVRDAHVIIYRSFAHVNQNVYAKFGGVAGNPDRLRDALRTFLGGADAARPPFSRPAAPFLYLWAPSP